MERPAQGTAIAPWPTTELCRSDHFSIFEVRTDKRVSPRTGREHTFHIIECRDWVNVIALTGEDSLVMIRQFRHGTNTVELEIPGGAVDAADPDPLVAGLRELREETGYAGRNTRIIGTVRPNPAIMNNTCHTVLVEDCHRLHDPSPDQGEDIRTEVMHLDEVREAIALGIISHALVIAAFHHFEADRNGSSG